MQYWWKRSTKWNRSIRPTQLCIDAASRAGAALGSEWACSAKAWKLEMTKLESWLVRLLFPARCGRRRRAGSPTPSCLSASTASASLPTWPRSPTGCCRTTWRWGCQSMNEWMNERCEWSVECRLKCTGRRKVSSRVLKSGHRGLNPKPYAWDPTRLPEGCLQAVGICHADAGARRSWDNQLQPARKLLGQQSDTARSKP